MAKRIADSATAQQIELNIGRLNSLSTLPAVASVLFSTLSDHNFSTQPLAPVVKSDAALAAKILQLAAREMPALSEYSIENILAALPPERIRDSLLSVPVFSSDQPDTIRALPRKQFFLYNLAVACCAERIAADSGVDIDTDQAYLAGLLAGVGLVALDVAMPKSFSKIVEDARANKQSLTVTEHTHIGTDHTTLGKHLAQKWGFPEPLMLAIWLQNTDPDIIDQTVPEATLAPVVLMASLVARHCGIGQSGSYDIPGSFSKIAEQLDITYEKIQQLKTELPELVNRACAPLALDLPGDAARYNNSVTNAVSSLARLNTMLSTENRTLQSASDISKFVSEYLADITTASGIEPLVKFAARFRSFYQASRLAIFVPAQQRSLLCEAVTIDNDGRIDVRTVEAGSNFFDTVDEQFRVTGLDESTARMLDELNLRFNTTRTFTVPIRTGSRLLALLVFELNYPVSAEQIQQRIEPVISIAASVMNLIARSRNDQRLTERFTRLVTAGSNGQTQSGLESAQTNIEALAEMAAGAAHELNNPLSVISGRAQLLRDSEEDAEKKRILDQIDKNGTKLADIIDDLMAYANPPAARFARTPVRQIIEEAAELAKQRSEAKDFDLEIELHDEDALLNVDSAQIATALANILANAAESYEEKPATVSIKSEADDGRMRIVVADQGVGMSPQALARATNPFFSDKPAGRKRGMGLANAQRLIHINKARLDITSAPAAGTTVTVTFGS